MNATPKKRTPMSDADCYQCRYYIECPFDDGFTDDCTAFDPSPFPEEVEQDD